MPCRPFALKSLEYILSNFSSGSLISCAYYLANISWILIRPPSPTSKHKAKISLKVVNSKIKRFPKGGISELFLLRANSSSLVSKAKNYLQLLLEHQSGKLKWKIPDIKFSRSSEIWFAKKNNIITGKAHHINTNFSQFQNIMGVNF